jgi:hypothetical protein
MKLIVQCSSDRLHSPMTKIKRLLSETNNAILAVGAIAAAILAVFGVVKAIMSLNEGGPTPPGLLAGIEDVTLIPNIGLAEYEAREQTAQVGGVAAPVALPAGYRLAVYTEATVPTSHSGTNDSEPETPSPSTSTPEPNPQSTPEPTPTTTTPEPHKHRLKKERHPREKGGGLGGTHKPPRHHPAPKQGEGVVHESAPEGSSGSNGMPFVKPPPPETSFKSEGHAQTLDGTGASPSEVEGVLAKASGSTPGAGRSPSEDGERETHSSTQTTPSSPSPRKTEALPFTEATTKIALPKHCDASCPLAPTVDQIIADSSNSAENARKLVTVFTHSRGRYIHHELHPFGADVEYTLKLTGFVGNDAILEWTLWSQSTGEPLPNSWWQRVIVKQVKPSRYEETVAGAFWAPIPPKRGDYAFHLVVYDEHGNRRGHGETPVFH